MHPVAFDIYNFPQSFDMAYKLTNSTQITRLSDSASIPTDPDNTDYAQYFLWLSEGNTPLPADPPSPPPAQQFTSLEYLDLFTEAEQLAVVSATMAAPEVKLWYDKMLAAGFITSADPRTEGGLAALVGAGLLTEQRKAEILAVMA